MRVLPLSEERYKPAESWAIAIMHARGLCEALFTMKHCRQLMAVSGGGIIILSRLFLLMQTIMIKLSGSYKSYESRGWGLSEIHYMDMKLSKIFF